MLFIRPAVLALAASALLSQAMAAESRSQGLAVDVKLRTGMDLSPNASPDSLARNFLGFGGGLSYPLGPGRVSAEVGYFYKAGTHFRQPFETPAAGKNPVVIDYVRNASGGMVGMPISADVRQNRMKGLTLRLGYEQQLTDKIGFQGGLQVGGTAFRHNYMGVAASQFLTSLGSLSNKGPADYRDVYWGTETSKGTDLSPYAGASWKFNRESSLEVNVLLLRYESIHFRHTPGAAVLSGSLDVAGSQVSYVGDEVLRTRRNRPQVELTYRFRL